MRDPVRGARQVANRICCGLRARTEGLRDRPGALIGGVSKLVAIHSRQVVLICEFEQPLDLGAVTCEFLTSHRGNLTALGAARSQRKDFGVSPILTTGDGAFMRCFRGSAPSRAATAR